MVEIKNEKYLAEPRREFRKPVGENPAHTGYKDL